MTYDNWRDAVADLRRSTRIATNKQHQLSTIAGLKLTGSLPEVVAGAMLQRALAEQLRIEPSRPISDYQRGLIEELGSGEQIACSPSHEGEAAAWITFLRLRKRLRALEIMQIEAGDVVRLVGLEDFAEVSSIGSDGRIYFRGGRGRGAWPDVVSVACRKRDTGANAIDLRRIAANQREAWKATDRWSLTKQDELRAFRVEQRLTADDIKNLLTTVETAKSEKPIQELVESNPQLLTSLLGGQERFCIPRVRLGAEFVPDFLVSAVNSLGILWVLVELETPRSDVTLRRENQLDKHARKGVSQIDEWKEWLLRNLAYARHSRRESGLGLIDIRPASEGLVIVGRRDRLHDNASLVRSPLQERRINVHTYDWWIEQLRGTLRHSGPYASNPFLMHRED